MWLLVLYDCPTATRENRRSYTRLHNLLLQENFIQHQFSVYVRHFPTIATAQAEVERIKPVVPDEGHVAFYFLTDKQYGMTREFFGKSATVKKPSEPSQTEMF